MKNLYKVFITLFISSFVSCSIIDDCSNMLCNSGPAGFRLELVDSQTGENLFTNGTYEESQLSLTQIAGDSDGDWNFISENDLNIIQIGTFESLTYSVKIAGDEIFQVDIDAEGVTGHCCFHTQVNDFQISGAEFEQDEETGIYRVLIHSS